MKLQEIYLKDINRKVNPAVSATQLDKETVKVEIDEYVFTKDILKNLFSVLTNIRNNSGSHCGIWISGYYGSGKSHFLKYLDYCMSPTYSEDALFRFETAASQYDAFKDDVNWVPSDIRDLTDWYGKKAKVETIMFNIGSSYNANSEGSRIITEVLWKEFNAMRGFNKFNIALAQYLEKYLDKQGKYEEFKQRLDDEYGFDWLTNASELAATELDIPLELAHDICPTFTVDAARQAIINNAVEISVNNFADELAQYIQSKNDPNFRLVFFVDEISQFINGDGRLLLQLQSIVKELHDRCNGQVWVACTAQQDLKEILDDCKINSSSDEFGKILGRFEVKASLQGTKSEYIAQQRILAKKPEAETELARFYDRSASAIDTQFQLPTTYEGYRDKESFIDFYPFVPYQLQLINKVFSHFVALNYVNKEVKGNERSVIRITHNIAKGNSQEEVGTFISFDQFFNDMFRASLQPSGVTARRNAEEAANKYDRDKGFAHRVVNVLFMICNMDDQDKQQFPATIENIVTLLMRDIDTPKTTMKDDVRRVIEHLIENSVIHEVKPEKGSEYYEFFTEEETQVSRLIQNQQVDNNTMAEVLASIITNYYTPQNKESIGSSSISIGASTSGKRMFGTTGGTDVEVEFVMNSPEADMNRYAFTNPHNTLVFFLTQLYSEDKRFNNLFYHYCQVQKFAKEPNLSPERRKTVEQFAQRERAIFETEIKKRFTDMLDSCPVISGQRVLSKADIGDIKGRARYKAAITAHIKSVFNMAHLVDGLGLAQTPQDLRAHIKRRLDTNEYALKPMSEAEENVQNFILRGRDVTVADVVATYLKAPFGWSEVTTIDIINELYRRNKFSYSYNNNPNVSIDEVAEKIVKEKKMFTLEVAHTVSPELIKDFKNAWQHVFNKPQAPANDAREVFRLCHDNQDSDLSQLIRNYKTLRSEIAKYPFVDDIDKMLDYFNAWKDIREQVTFFETVIAQKDEAATLFDRGKMILEFKREQLDNYRDIIQFVNSNQSNFELLGEGAKADIDQLKEILTDAEVFTHFQDYRRLMKAVKSAIGKKRDDLLAQVRTAYEQLYSQIRSLAADKEVATTFLPDLENEMFKIKQSGMSLYQLRDKTDTSDLYASYVGQINNQVAIHQQQQQAQQQAQQQSDDQKEQPKQQVKQTKQINVITLDTSITIPLKTEHDVDLYLASLKEELMKHINNNEEILIKK